MILTVPIPDLVVVDPGDVPFAPRSGRGVLHLRLRPFAIGRHPVTNNDYALFVKAMRHSTLPSGWNDGSPPPHEGRHPVRGITATDAEAYCRWLSNVTGRSYRLPQEIEWEYAAGGPDRLRYPWGNEFDPTRCVWTESGEGGSAPVDAHPRGASPVGCLDMVGNVAEYCADIFRPYDSPDPSGEIDVDGALARSLRGGSYRSSREALRCAARSASAPENFDVVGFRLCTPDVADGDCHVTERKG